MKIISVATMRALDRRTIESGVPGEVLMDRAGRGAAEAVLDWAGFRLEGARRFVLLAGKGNNGGDAYAAARYLAEWTGLDVVVFSAFPRSELRGAAAAHAGRLPQSVEVAAGEQPPEGLFRRGAILIDGLLGTGVSGAPRPPIDGLIQRINASGLPVAALDVPSGMNADTGEASGPAVTADLTVTMGLPKRGLLTPAGLARCGALRCIDIGIPDEFIREAEAHGEAVFAEDVRGLLGRRPAAGHKGRFGHVLVAGGSRFYAGAPILAGAAALRVGAGLATVVMPGAARALAPHAPRALIVQELPDGGAGFFTAESAAAFPAKAEGKRVIVVGPGIGSVRAARPILSAALETEAAVVVDADALRAVDERSAAQMKARRAPVVLTPHPGEMRALAEQLRLEAAGPERARADQASAAARACSAWVVLKGLGTVIAAPDGAWAINTSGNSALATGGSGDVLAGMIAGFLGQGLPVWDAVRLAVFIHGRCAEESGRSQRGLIADDLLEEIDPVLRRLNPLA